MTDHAGTQGIPAAPPVPQPDLSILIVSWNVRDLLRRCLASLESSLAGGPWSYETIVVDNDSADGSESMVRAEFPSAELAQTGANLGFAGGVNAGLARCRGAWVFVLNPDTELVGAALPTLLDFAAAHPELAVLGPQLRYPDGTLQSSRRRFPTPLTYFMESTLLARWWPANPWARRYHVADRPADEPQQVDWLVGAALLVRRAAIERAGGLDPAFWMYSEELEWQRRLGREGEVWYLPQAVVIHHEGKSSEQAPARKHLAFQRSKLRYAARADGPALATALHLFLLACYAADWLTEAAKWLLGHRRELRRERMRVYSQVLRGLMAP
jgi:GT2 family glycosyltransferase